MLNSIFNSYIMAKKFDKYDVLLNRKEKKKYNIVNRY